MKHFISRCRKDRKQNVGQRSIKKKKTASQQETNPEDDDRYALNYNEEAFYSRTKLGQMNVICTHCNASRFKDEGSALCCGNGKIKLPNSPEAVPYLKKLLLYEDNDSNTFMNNIRLYNCAFQMTSFGCKQRQLDNWNPTFTVQGQIYHRIGSLRLEGNQSPKFLQIYFMDSAIQEQDTRLSIFRDVLKPHIVQKLSQCLHEHNNYVKSIKTALDFIDNENGQSLRIVMPDDKRPANQQERRYNTPCGSEIGILMPNEPTATRDIIIHNKDGSLQHISELHRAYDPLQYPLLFVHGTDGYNLYLKTVGKSPKCSTMAII